MNSTTNYKVARINNCHKHKRKHHNKKSETTWVDIVKDVGKILCVALSVYQAYDTYDKEFNKDTIKEDDNKYFF